MITRIPDEYENKFRFCVVASVRAAQIQNGAFSKLASVSNNPAYVAIKEGEANLIRWQILVAEELSPDE